MANIKYETRTLYLDQLMACIDAAAKADDEDSECAYDGLETAAQAINEFLEECLQGHEVVAINGVNLRHVDKIICTVDTVEIDAGREMLAAYLTFMDVNREEIALYYLVKDDKALHVDFMGRGLRNIRIER